MARFCCGFLCVFFSERDISVAFFPSDPTRPCLPLLSEFAYGLLPVLAEQTSTQLSVSLASGLVAGVCAAIVSQPGTATCSY